jgi:hypothetical protein
MITLPRVTRYLADRAHEARWRMGPCAPRRPLTWAVDPDLLRRVAVRWPAVPPPGIDNWVATVRQGFAALVRTEPTDLPQPRRGVVMFEVGVDGERVKVGLDCRDASDVIDEYVDTVRLYFKMQHRKGGYGRDDVLPAGYVPGEPALYEALPFVRGRRDAGAARYDVYGRFGLHSAREIRRRAVGMLSEQRRFRFEGGVAKIRYSRYLRELSAAKICLDLPGQGDFCFRLVDYLAVGTCIVAVRHGNRLPVPLRDGHEIAYVRDDLSDLVEVCERYLGDGQARRRLEHASREYFDRYLHREQLASYYVHSILRTVGVVDAAHPDGPPAAAASGTAAAVRT